MRFDVRAATRVDQHQQAHEQHHHHDEPERRARVAIDPGRGEAWKESADEPNEIGYPAQPGVILVGALRAAHQRKDHQPDRRADGCEIENAALPDLVPDMFLRLGARRCAAAVVSKPYCSGVTISPSVLDDIVIGRQADRRIGMRVVFDALEHALVDLGAPDVDLVLFQLPGLPIEVRHQLARPVAIIAAKALARIVQPSVLVPLRNRILEGVGIGNHEVGIGRLVGIVRLEFEPASFALR